MKQVNSYLWYVRIFLLSFNEKKWIYDNIPNSQPLLWESQTLTKEAQEVPVQAIRTRQPERRLARHAACNQQVVTTEPIPEKSHIKLKQEGVHLPQFDMQLYM